VGRRDWVLLLYLWENMLNRSIVIGNGRSRNSVNLEHIASLGRTYGCNAVYRDFDSDVLVTVDNGMMHEIYCNYVGNAEVYFRNWNPLPWEMRDLLPVFGTVVENERKDAVEFTMNGASHATHITWLNRDLQPFLIDDARRPDNRDIEDWSTGTTAIRLACEQGADEINLIGFDIGSTDDKVNNIYAGTRNYVSPDYSAEAAYNEKNSADNWNAQHEKNFTDFPDVSFIQWGPVIESWQVFDNVSFLNSA